MTNEFYKPISALAEGRGLEAQKTRAAYEFGSRNSLTLFQRFVILETIFDPSIVDPAKIDYFEHVLEVSNISFANVLPRNSVVAKRVMGPQGNASSPAMFLFPFFPPNLSLPCQPGEHIWVMFENQENNKNDIGYWFCRIVEPGFIEDVNHTHPPRAFDPSFSPTIKDVFNNSVETKYEFRNGRADTRDGERYTIAETATIIGDETAYEKLITETDGSKLSLIEPVPRYKKRPPDTVLEGSNNTLIVLGRDRLGTIANYKTDDQTQATIVSSIPDGDKKSEGAGAIDIVVGRGQTPSTLGKIVESTRIDGSKLGFKELAKAQTDLEPKEGDPDFINDRSRLYVSQKTSIDQAFGLTQYNSKLSAGTFQGGTDSSKSKVADGEGTGAVGIKSDKIRIIARSDVEIIVCGYSKNNDGKLVDELSTDEWASITIKANGDIVMTPAKKGYIKLGGDDADKAILCSDLPAAAMNGVVSGPPLVTTMGGLFAGATPAGDTNQGMLAPGQGKFASKVLIK